MLFVACSGFPIAASRYLREFMAVELSDTALGIPGQGSVRRWLRESSEGFAFTMLAPNAFGDSKFKKTPDNKELIDQIGELSSSLDARAVVLQEPEGFRPTKAHRDALKSFVKSLPRKWPCPVVLDFPSWEEGALAEIVDGKKILAAYDPLALEEPVAGKLVYYALPGPAGKRSRYDEPSLEKVAEICGGTEAEQTFCVFRNIDMVANARTLRVLLGQEE